MCGFRQIISDSCQGIEGIGVIGIKMKILHPVLHQRICRRGRILCNGHDRRAVAPEGDMHLLSIYPRRVRLNFDTVGIRHHILCRQAAGSNQLD